MARRLIADAATTLLARLDEPGGGTPIDVGPNSLPMTNVGSTAVTGITDMPFTVSRQFVRASGQYLYAQSNLLHTASLSFECWFKLNSLPSGGQTYSIASNYNTNGWMAGVRESGGVKVFFYVQNNSPAYLEALTPALTTGVWYHFCGTQDATSRHLYLDGVLIASSAGGSIAYTSGQQTRIGDIQGLSWFFDGEIADVRISNRLRAPWEDHNTISAVKDPAAGFDAGTGSLAVYNFNNPSEGATVYDDVGNHNGSVVGSVPLSAGPVSANKRGYSANGANRIEIPHHADFQIDTDWTIELWVTLIPGSVEAFLGKGSWGGTPSMCIVADPNGYPYALIGTTSGYLQAFASGFALTSGKLYYLAVTFDRVAKRLLLYRDGTFLVAGAESGSYAGGDTTEVLKLGCRFSSNSDPLWGDLHAVRWSNYVKTAKEIFDQYNGTAIREDG